MRTKFNTVRTMHYQCIGAGSSPAVRSKHTQEDKAIETRETLSEYTFCEVSKDDARECIIKNHYSHKWSTPFGVHNYGLRSESGELLAVASYGNPMNPKSYKSIANVTQEQFIELNRLWADDRLGKNTETWLMAESHKRLREHGIALVQSFADGRLGVGTIYQAAGFGFYGRSSTMFHQNNVTGDLLHDVPFQNTASQGVYVRNAMHARGELSSFTVNTYKYLMPLTKAARRRIILKQKPYPKERLGVTELLDYTPPVRQVVRGYAKALALGHQAAEDLAPYIDQLGATEDDIAVAVDNKWVLKSCDKQGVNPEELGAAMRQRATTLASADGMELF